jgi:hypothetical protein
MSVPVASTVDDFSSMFNHGKLNLILDEIGLYRSLQIDASDPSADLFKSTVRYREPRNGMGSGVDTQGKRVLFIINSINNTWFHYHISRLLPDWFIVSLDMRYNGHDTVASGIPVTGGDRNDLPPYVGDMRNCYDDIEFCFNYFNFNMASSLVMYGYGYGGLLALGFHHDRNVVTALVDNSDDADGVKQRSFRVTHLILNSPHIVNPDRVNECVTRMVYNPASFISPTTSQDGLVAKSYDSTATIVSSYLPRVLAGISVLGASTHVALAAGATIVAKNLFTVASNHVSSSALQRYGAALDGKGYELPHIAAIQQHFFIEAGTLSSTLNSPTLAFGRSVTSLQDAVTCRKRRYIKCPTLALFSVSGGCTTASSSVAFDTGSTKASVKQCIETITAACDPDNGSRAVIYRFPDVYNDTLLSSTQLPISKSVYSLLMWLENEGIELLRDDGSALDMTTVGVVDICRMMNDNLRNSTILDLVKRTDVGSLETSFSREEFINILSSAATTNLLQHPHAAEIVIRGSMLRNDD